MFEHSVKVPRLYKIAAKLAQEVKEKNASLKRVVFENKHVNKKGLYALILETLQHESQIDFLFRKCQILVKEDRLDIWLARILVTELLWGKKKLPGESKPVKTILGYQQMFNAHLDEVHIESKNLLNKSVSKPRYVRVNTISTSVNEAVEGFIEEGWTLARFTDHTNYEGFLERVSNLGPEEFMMDIHIKDLLIFPNRTQFYQHKAYKNGCIFLQDKASCLPAKILNPQPGSTVLDMCAAPGMKTSQIAAMMNNEGTVFAVERDLKRLQILNKFIETSGGTCVSSINSDVLTVTKDDCPNVEYILVDPSCSGSGITDRLELDSNYIVTDEKRLKNLAGFQIKILKHALRSFPDVKRVVYSTCSLNPQENEEVVKEVISSSQRYKLVPALDLLEGPWFNFGSEDYGEIGRLCLYAQPEQDLTNGFFVAVFEKLDEGEENPFYNNTWNTFMYKQNRGRNNNREANGSGENVSGENVSGENVSGENVSEENVNGDNFNEENVRGENETGGDVNCENVKDENGMNENKNGESNETEDNIHKVKKCKRRHKHETKEKGHLENEEESLLQNEIPKIKKKKKHHKDDGNEKMVIEEAGEDAQIAKKSKKKSKKHLNDERILEEIIPKEHVAADPEVSVSKLQDPEFGESGAEASTTKKKKKSKKSRGDLSGQNELIDSTQKKKHKKKKQDIPDEEITEDLGLVKVKRCKHKKDKHTSEMDDDTEEKSNKRKTGTSEEEDTLVVKKKKKHST